MKDKIRDLLDSDSGILHMVGLVALLALPIYLVGRFLRWVFLDD